MDQRIEVAAPLREPPSECEIEPVACGRKATGQKLITAVNGIENGTVSEVFYIPSERSSDNPIIFSHSRMRIYT